MISASLGFLEICNRTLSFLVKRSESACDLTNSLVIVVDLPSNLPFKIFTVSWSLYLISLLC